MNVDKHNIKPPMAQRKRHMVSIHEQKWNDSYYYMRDKENQDVIDYLNQENEYTSKVMKDTEKLQSDLFKEMKNRINETDQTVPTKEGNYYYYSRTEKGKNYSIYCRKFKTMKAKEEVLLDMNKISDGKNYSRLGSLDINFHHDLMAYSIDETGAEVYTIYVKDLKSGKTLDYNIANTGGRVLFSPDNKLYYNTIDEIKRSYRIFQHSIRSSDPDLLIYEEENKEFGVGAFLSSDKKFLFIESYGRESSVVKYIDLEDATNSVISFNHQKDQVEFDVDHHGGYFYFITSDNAINFRFCRTKVGKNDAENWDELVPTNTNRRLKSIKLFESFGILEYRENGISGIRIFNIETFSDHSIKFHDDVYVVGLGANPNFKTNLLRVRYSSPVTPSTVYDYDIETKMLLEKKKEIINKYNKDDFVVNRKYALARDGEKIPLTIVSKKENQGTSPLLLYGYGSYGITIEPNFNSKIISLLERGIVFVIAHIRGGGMLGKKWYHDGKLLKKKNTFYDFIDSAKFLIQNGYTSSEKLAIQGGSAGGLLMGAVTNIEPQLFKSVVAQVPFVDVINTMLDDSIPLTTFEYLEWGNPNDLEYFEYMMSYSPYDQVGINSKYYPNMLVMAGLNDPRVHYWEPAKWVAKLRKIKKDNNVLLLKTNMSAGHGGSSGRYDYLKEVAFVYSFLIKTIS